MEKRKATTTVGRGATERLLKKQAADDQFAQRQKLLARHKLIERPATGGTEIIRAEVVKLPPPKQLADNAKSTLGVKRTKAKMGWFSQADDSDRPVLKRYGYGGEEKVSGLAPLIACQSRGYESRKDPYRFRVRGNTLVYENDNKCEILNVLQYVERIVDGEPVCQLEWLIDLGEHPKVYERSCQFLGLDLRSENCFDNLPAERRALFTISTIADRERLREAAKKAKRNSRNRNKKRKSAETNDAGQPRQQFKLY